MTAIPFVLAALLSAELPIDAPLVPGAVPMDEPGRYRSARSYDETLEFYERLFRRTGGVRWHNVVNLPGIKAKNISSLRQKTTWEGINVYESRGQVTIYVLACEKPPASETTKATGKPRRGKKVKKSG